jgi:hypothetical protein
LNQVPKYIIKNIKGILEVKNKNVQKNKNQLNQPCSNCSSTTSI